MSITVQELLFNELGAVADASGPETIFILAAPRTGSTTLYKAMISGFGLPFIANITNDHFPQTPVVGMSVQKSMPAQISTATSYGKTRGAFQPSEGSSLFTHWFGGGHPSQITSHSIIKSVEPHFLRSLTAIEKLFNAPLIVKNAWNCFRVQYLATALPNARFVWLQRDIVDAASSDFQARLVTKNSGQSWNSATPANYKTLLTRPPAEQVVENQFEFNRAIGDSLAKFTPNRWIRVWYEEFVDNPKKILQHISDRFSIPRHQAGAGPVMGAPEGHKLDPARQKAVADYARSANNYVRFQPMFFGG